jgi:hypothetical protein
MDGYSTIVRGAERPDLDRKLVHRCHTQPKSSRTELQTL